MILKGAIQRLRGLTASALGSNFAIGTDGKLKTSQPWNKTTSTSETITAAYAGSIVSFNNASAVAATIAQANSAGFTAGFAVFVKNIGAGMVTITPSTSTIDGLSALKLPTGASGWIVSDGTNYGWFQTTFGRGPWANRPAANAVSAGTKYFVTDLTTSGFEIYSNGTKWKPVGGMALIAQFNSTAANVNLAASETNFQNMLIPAGMATEVSEFLARTESSYVGTTAAKVVVLRHHSTSGSTSGGTAFVNSNLGGSNTHVYACAEKAFHNYNNSVSSQRMSNTTGLNTSSSATGITGSVNMANDSYICCNLTGNAADTGTFFKGSLYWIEA